MKFKENRVVDCFLPADKYIETSSGCIDQISEKNLIIQSLQLSNYIVVVHCR